MIILITGSPGSGKSLYIMHLLEREEFQGRPVFSNIPGTDHQLMPESADWRQTPEGSIVIYDEAQQFFPGTGRAGNSNDERIQGMETHRHSGHDLILATQRYALVHHHVRGLVGRHIHLVKRGSGFAVAHVSDEVFDPNDRVKLSTVSEELFRYPKSLYEKYQSSSLHTAVQTKRKLPWKIKAVFGVAAALFLLVGWKAVSVMESWGSPPEIASEQSVMVPISRGPELAQVEPVEDWRSLPIYERPSFPGVSGCISSASACTCYAPDGDPLHLTMDECRELSSNPLPRSIRLGTRHGPGGTGASRPGPVYPSNI